MHVPKTNVLTQAKPATKLSLSLPLLLGLLFGLAPLVVAPVALYEYAELPKGLFVKIGGLALALSFLVIRRTRRLEFRLLVASIDAPILAFLGWAAVSVLWAHDKYSALIRLSHLTAAWLIYLVVRDRVRDREKLAVFYAVGLASLLVSALGLMQAWLSVEWVPQSRGPAATFGNRLLAGDFVLFALPILAFFVISKQRLILQLAALAGLTGSFVYLFVAVTKGAMVAAIAQLLAMPILLGIAWVRSEHRRRFGPVARWVTLAVLVVVLAGAITSTMKSDWSEVWVQQYRSILKTINTRSIGPQSPTDRLTDAPAAIAKARDDSSFSVRAAVWQNTLGMIWDRPLVGVGLDNFKVFYPAYAFSRLIDGRVMVNEEWPQTHNDYLQTAAELGMVGLVISGWFLWSLGRLAFPLLSSAESRATTVVCLTALIGLLVDMGFNFPLQSAVPPLFAALCIGLLASYTRTEQTVPARSPKRGASNGTVRPQIIPVALASVCVVWAVWAQTWETAGSYYLARTMAASDQKRWSDAIWLGKETLRYNPRSHEALQFLSQAYYLVDDSVAAARAAEAVLAIRPFYRGALNNLALARAKTGDRDGAIDAYRKVIRLAPYNAETYGALGKLYLLQKRYDEAVDNFRIASRYDPDDPENYFGMGLAFYDSGQFQRAEEPLQKAVEKAPTSTEYRYYLGLTKMQLGHLREARLQLEEVLRLKPDFARARVLTKRLAMLEAEQQGAARH